MPRISKVWLVAVVCAGVALSGCGGSDDAGSGPSPQEVGVVVVAPRTVDLGAELPGRLEASRVAEVRARAAGIVLERAFQEGSDVTEGQVLFRIDPAPMKAAYDRARAQLARAEASLKQATLRAERYAPLVETRAVSQQDYDDAVAARDAAAADVALARAAVTTAKLDLEYATVTAPISGRIGAALVTEGALVGQGEATRLATIQQIDPLYLDLTQSSAEVLRMRRALAEGTLDEADAVVTVVTDDGRAHPHQGKLLFTDITVDETTGALVLRAEVPNPGGALLPGMYVRARISQGVLHDALLVPQQAVLRDANGATVKVVSAEDTVEIRPIVTGRTVGDEWIVESGLQPGDRVIVDGIQKARPGAPVTAATWQPLSRAAGGKAPETH